MFTQPIYSYLLQKLFYKFQSHAFLST